MNDHEKSDECVVPKKRPNNECATARSAEGVEGKRSTKGSSTEAPKDRTQRRVCLATSPLPSAGTRWSTQRFTLSPRVGAQCGSSARWDLCGGRRNLGLPRKRRPYRDTLGALSNGSCVGWVNRVRVRLGSQ